MAAVFSGISLFMSALNALFVLDFISTALRKVVVLALNMNVYVHS